MDEVEIEIRPSEEDQLDFLEAEFSPHDLSKHHHQRHAVQKSGHGVYFIAWHNAEPIGHFLLEWAGPGPGGDPTGEYPYPTPYLGAGQTVTEYRRKGVATRLIQKAEELAKEHGFSRIGLAVGSTDNPDAKRLYEKLGYIAWGKGEFEASWEYTSKDGKIGRESEVCIYMFKHLE
jgi:GNAT superfamily N-acetyltransferase